LYRVGATADWSMEATEARWHRIGQNVNLVNLEEAFDGVLTPPEREREWLARQRLAQGVARSRGQYAVRAITIENQVTHENVATFRRNHRIIPVLAQTTGQEIGNNPQQWWDWWQNYNEYYVPEERPVYEQRYVDISHNYVQMMSCFAKGTPVWTKTDLVPIETLEMGDLVLSQDADTGELAYKPIIGRTVRPPSKILKLKIGGSELNTTLGHPFWVAGVGWRMAKEVEDGAMLHALTGAAEVKGFEKAGEAEAFNLVVADFSTYFVGEQGLLVHDNTPRKPTRAAVPGLVMQ